MGTIKQTIQLLRSSKLYANRAEAIAALELISWVPGMPAVVRYDNNPPVVTGAKPTPDYRILVAVGNVNAGSQDVTVTGNPTATKAKYDLIYDESDIAKVVTLLADLTNVVTNQKITIEEQDGTYTFKEGGTTIATITLPEGANYTAGDGILFTGRVVSVKLGEGSTKKNFIKTEDSTSGTKAIAVRGMDTDVTTTTEDITLAGGPLAELFKEVYPDGKLPKGTNLQDMFKKLLCVELWPTPKNTTGSYTTTLPALSLTADVTNGALVEVGQVVNMKPIKSVVTSINKTSAKVDGLTYGYADSASGPVNHPETSIVKNWTITSKAEPYVLTATIAGGELTSTTNTVSNNDVSLSKLDAVKFKAGANNNTLTITSEGPTQTGNIEGIDVVYYASNLKNVNADHKTTAIAAQNNIEKKPSNKTTTFVVTGVYPIFTNGKSISTADGSETGSVQSPAAFADDTKLPLTTNTTIAVNYPSESAEKTHYKLYLHGKKVTDAKAFNPTNNTYSVPYIGEWKQEGTKNITVQGQSITYDVWTTVGTPSRGANKVKFIIANK